MYDFHDSFLKEHFDAGLVFTDEIKSEDLYEEFFKYKHLLDFINYPKTSKFFDKTNKKVKWHDGKLKEESEEKIIDEIVRLKSKIYSIKIIDGKVFTTVKGMNIATAFNEFKDTFFNKKIMRYKMRRIQAKNHKIEIYEINKISSSCFQDKIFILDDECV